MERLPAQVGATVELGEVLLVADDKKVEVGRPLVEGARVIAEVVGHGRDDKVLVFKYKAKTRYRRKGGHRQPYTRLAIRHILLAGESPPAIEGPTAEVEAQAKPSARRRATARRPKVSEATTSEPKRRKKTGSE